MRSVELDPHSAGRTFILVDVKSNLLTQQFSTSLKKSSVHRSLEAMRAKHQLEVRDSHSLLPQFLRRHSDLNPEVVLALQLDDQDCFMRLFVTIPRFAEVFSKLCLPMLHLDGAYSKRAQCDGMISRGSLGLTWVVAVVA
jgi:hypothetical protein